MLLSDAMKSDTGVYPGDGVVGREQTPWYSVATLTVESRGLDVADLGGANPVRIALPNGPYCIEGRLINFGGSLCLSRIRARAEGIEVRLGEKLGIVSVDLAHIEIADSEALKQGLTTQEVEELAELSGHFMSVICDICRLNFETKTVYFVVCQSGFGDGVYPVFALRRGNEVVGLEVEFIRDGHLLKDFH
jgi:hypothetical protein